MTFDADHLAPVTLGTTVLGKRESANPELADALLASPFPQIDTSNVYAAGQSEKLLGDAIGRAGGLPAGKTVFSKVDQHPETGRFDGDRVLRSFEETLERLRLDRLPLLHLHDPYTITFAEAMAPGGAVEALTRLRDEGAVDAIGIAAGTRELVERYVSSDAFDAVLTHNRYTLVDRSAERILQLAAERDMAVFNAAPFGGGILAGSQTRGATYGYRPASPELLAFIERLHTTAADLGVDLTAAALQFSLREPRIHSTVVGIYSLERLQDLPRLTETQITEEFWSAVGELGTPPPSPND
ncbi:aldo/keto reductase [Georgenia thermotolerans]|uniref:Aldo/keto reductase n=1 Tax=Georgenia thermotolerans TaxID=527326 RepID=A0A7J5UUF5_9MICO|nr:aldo/keto reductase [Georgenia thermotolerans]KAE8765925.1 aldo/keto reductase [Georgenia thermotolerans]